MVMIGSSFPFTWEIAVWKARALGAVPDAETDDQVLVMRLNVYTSLSFGRPPKTVIIGSAFAFVHWTAEWPRRGLGAVPATETGIHVLVRRLNVATSL
tara:strand:- start:555 stop:848 length:294 start_codon:yes stop_codon:yes gene_type:complete